MTDQPALDLSDPKYSLEELIQLILNTIPGSTRQSAAQLARAIKGLPFKDFGPENERP